MTTAVRLVLACFLTGFLALLGAPAGAARADVSCAGVWVVVDRTTRCATAYSTGSEALRSAGFSITRSGGLICQIDRRPEVCKVTMKAYWSYWQSRRNPDGGFGPWVYATVGPDSYHPRQGDAEGWAFGDGSTPPRERPARGPAGGSPSAVAASPSASVVSASAAPGPATPAAGTSSGLIVTAALLVVGAGALGGWWWLRRRP